MGQIKWYKRDPSAALNGMMELTLEERGAYNTVLDLIYSRDGNLPDDDRFIAGWLRVDVRVWKRIKTTLVERGKLYLKEGNLRNGRADVEVLSALSRVGSAREAGLASANSKLRKSIGENQQNNGLGSTDVGTGAATGVPTNHNHNQNIPISPSGDIGASGENSGTKEQPQEPEEKPPPTLEIDPRKIVFDAVMPTLMGVGYSEPRARAVIGKWRKTFTDGRIVDAIVRCTEQKTPPAEPISWITQLLHHERPAHERPDKREPQESTMSAAIRERKAERAAGIG